MSVHEAVRGPPSQGTTAGKKKKKQRKKAPSLMRKEERHRVQHRRRACQRKVQSCHGRRPDQLPGPWGQGVFTKRARSAAVNVLRVDASLQHTAVPAAGAPSLCRFDFSANYKMSLESPPRLQGGSDDSALCHCSTHAAACIGFMPG